MGYAGGTTSDPTYGDVCSGKTGHAEVVEVKFDPAVVPFDQLLKVWLALHDPTMDARHYRGGQYRSLVYYTSEAQREQAQKILDQVKLQLSRPVVSQLSPAPTFWEAEQYHQKYYAKHKVSTCAPR